MSEYTPCRKYFGYGHDMECVQGIIIDIDEYTEGCQTNLIRPPCECNPKRCKTCNGSGNKEYECGGIGDCPDCNCGWIGEIEFIEYEEKTK